nr:hypothetical protein [Aequorivita sp. S2608]
MSFSQVPGNPYVDAGPDKFVACGDTCTDITAEFFDIGDTSTYTVGQIFYNPPFPFNGLANSMNPDVDDRWSGVEDLPFDLCFFGSIRNEFQVGSNGVLTFDVDPNNTFNAWSFDGDLPNNTEAALSEANVFTPVHDLDPTKPGNEEIGYEVIGAAPNRVLVLSYYEVPLFGSGCSEKSTQMVVFYETTNIVDIYIKNKPTCTWNSGNAALGIQNNAGTVAHVPPGRNTSDSPWTAENEAWRFYPAGPSVVTFEWLDAAGNVIGTDPTINVCPNGSEIYTAKATYTSCNGEEVVVTDEIRVSVPSEAVIASPPLDLNQCDDGTGPGIFDLTQNNAVVRGGQGANFPVTYHHDQLAAETGVGEIDPDNAYPIVGTSEIIWVRIEDPSGSCYAVDSFEISFATVEATQPATPHYICDQDENGQEPINLEASFNSIILNGQAPLSFSVTYHDNPGDANSGNNPFPQPYTVAAASTTIYGRVESNQDPDCFETTDFEIILDTPPTINPTPDPLIACDDDSNGFTDFFLHTADDDITGGDPTLTVTYHYTEL